MKYLKQYENWINNSEYKRYIITKYESDKHDDIYINLYENLYHTKKINFFSLKYYYDETTDKIVKVTGDKEMNFIPINKIVYESNKLSDALEVLDSLIKTDKYNL